jgi:hypothetical protein
MGVRDAALNQALKQLATEAATHLSGLVASGDQIPFDVAEQAGPDSLFHSYRPLTARYVRERGEELRALPGFEPAREAVIAADLAATYLEQRGEAVPADPAERAAQMLVSFFASLWDGCTELSLDRSRLDEALAVLDAEIGDVDEADVLIAPIVGLQMAVTRLQLPHGMLAVRADSVDAPLEAMRSEGMGRRAWEPQFLAIAEQGDGEESAAEALRQMHELISVMRLFKGGGVGLGPYAFAPSGEGGWRRLATGAPAVRPGGYRLGVEEAEDLARFATNLEVRPDPDGALTWAVGRFELGCGRESAMEGLSDHLLALRAVLEGKGPVGASLPMRAAALIDCGPGGRLIARERVEAALELERSLMRGGPVAGTPELAAWIEESVRGILREAALGELGADLGTAADESLIATGLEAGDVEVAVKAEPVAEPEPEPEIDDVDADECRRPPVLYEPVEWEASPITESQHEENHEMEDTRIMEPVPAEDEIRITATNWLEEVEVETADSTLDFPAIEGDVAHRERIDTPRVRHLFPVPEDADWEVRELDYDHYERRHTG